MAVTLGGELERLRLRRRALRLGLLIGVLGERREAGEGSATLERMIAGLRRELERIHGRLDEL